MNLRKAALGACVALVAVVFAAPSMASATWTHNQEAIGENAKIPFGGTFGFTLGGPAGTQCEVTGEIEAEQGTTTGKLLHFQIGHHGECASYGSLAGCTVQSATVTNEELGGTLTQNPAVVHIINGHIVATKITIDTTYANPDPDCPATHNELHIPSVTLNPDIAISITHLTVVGGTATVTLGLKSVGGATIDVGNATLKGKLNVLVNGTWGILSETV